MTVKLLDCYCRQQTDENLLFEYHVERQFEYSDVGLSYVLAPPTSCPFCTEEPLDGIGLSFVSL